MTLQELKSIVQKNDYEESLLIFNTNNADTFIPEQYIREIARTQSLNISYLDSIDSYTHQSSDLFLCESDTTEICVYRCVELKVKDIYVTPKDRLIIITSKIPPEYLENLRPYVVDVRKLESWQIKDYIYSLGEGADEADLDELQARCKDNIYRTDSEISKVSLFAKAQRKYVLKELLTEGSLCNENNFNIFNFTNALQVKDIDAAKNILLRRDFVDIEPLGLSTILHQNLRKMICVWLSPNPTPETTGLKSNQIWAIRNLPKKFSKDQLIRLFEEINLIDYKLKSGLLPEDLIIDYIVIKCFAL